MSAMPAQTEKPTPSASPSASPSTSTFAQKLLALLARIDRHCPLPRVKALHLPPASAAGTKDGEFCAIELEDGSLGLSYVMLDDTLNTLAGDSAATGDNALAGLPALALAQEFVSGSGARRVLGFAAANAISQCFLARAGYAFDDTTDSIGGLQPGPADHVGMIGHFTQLIPRIVERGARLTVAELNPDFAGDHDGYRVTLDARELDACNKILSTSTVLLNDTLDDVLAHCRQAAWFAMVGPNAGCLPDPLFARGVGTLGGVRVTDHDAFVSALVSGERWGAFTRKYAIRRDDYPGFEALLGRV